MKKDHLTTDGKGLAVPTSLENFQNQAIHNPAMIKGGDPGDSEAGVVFPTGN